MREPVAQFRPIPGVDTTIANLMGVDYLVRRSFLRRSMRGKFSRFLYKFRSLRRTEPPRADASTVATQSVDWLRAVIVDSALRLSSPNELNDPFELSARWVVEGGVEERRRRYAAIVKAFAPDATSKQRENAVGRLIQAPSELLVQMVQKNFEAQRTTFNVYCLASDPRSVLMWSHYAAEHTGICLQFEVARDLPVFTRALAVDYIAEGPGHQLDLRHEGGNEQSAHLQARAVAARR